MKKWLVIRNSQIKICFLLKKNSKIKFLGSYLKLIKVDNKLRKKKFSQIFKIKINNKMKRSKKEDMIST
jgi:hypothetical protein